MLGLDRLLKKSFYRGESVQSPEYDEPGTDLE